MQDLNLRFARWQFRIGHAARRRLWLKLAKLLGNGVPIIEALTTLHDRRVRLKGKGDTVAVAMGDWLRRMRNGQSLSTAITGWVDHAEQMLIAAGEQSGNLDASLRSTAEVMEAAKKIKAAVIGGLFYPGVMILLALGVLLMFSYKIIPEFSQIVPYERWVGGAKLMVDFANFVRDWIVLILGLPVLVLIAFIWSLPRWKDGIRIQVDKHLPYSIYRILHGSTWMISFASLVGAGVRMENALQQLNQNASPWMSARIQACLRGMRSGANPGDALAKSGYGFPDLEIIDDLGVYARLSGFDQALSTIGREWITESVERIQLMMKTIFGISVLFVGISIAVMVSGLFAMQLQMTAIMQGTFQ